MKQNKSISMGKVMKKLCGALFMVVLATATYAQKLDTIGFNYQAVARDASGIALGNKAIVVEISIRKGSETGNTLWQETHEVKTNSFGLFSVIIGRGNTTGVGSLNSFNELDWSQKDMFTGVRADFGNGLLPMGNVQLQAVPYAFVADTALAAPRFNLKELLDVDVNNLTKNDILKWDGSKWVSGQLSLSDFTSIYSKIQSDSTALRMLINANASDISMNATNIAANTSDISQNTSDIAEEVTRATNAETTLTTDLATESTNRIAGDNANASSITTLSNKQVSDSTALRSLINTNTSDISTYAVVIANNALNNSINETDINALETLADGKIYLGNASNVATEVELDGDVTVDNTGWTTISNSAITTAKLNDGAVTTAKITDANVTDAKIATGVDAAKLADGSVSNTEFQYINTLSSNVQDQLDGKADLASPILTGTPLAPTATAGTNTTQIATTAFVTDAVSTAVGDYLPLTGGTLTGGLSGTTANFSDNSTIEGTLNVNNFLTVTTNDEEYGIKHTDGNTTIATYIDNQSGRIGTTNDIPFAIYSNNNSSAGLIVDQTGNQTILSTDLRIKDDFVVTGSNGNITTSGKLSSGDVTYPNTDGSANQVLTTDGSGTLSWTDNGSSFIGAKAYASGTTSLGTSWTQVALATEEFDTGNDFASNVFTVPSNGYYMITGAIFISNGQAMAAGFSTLGFRKNGSTILFNNSSYFNSPAPEQSLHGSTVVLLNAGDTIDLVGKDSSSSPLRVSTGVNNTFLSVTLMGR